MVAVIDLLGSSGSAADRISAMDCVDYESYLHRTMVMRNVALDFEVMDVDGALAFVRHRDGGFVVLDLTGETPAAVGEIGGPAPLALRAAGERVYAQLGSGVLIYDVSDPSQPSFAVAWQMHLVRAIAAAGSALYVANDRAIRVIDVSSIDEPLEVATIETEGYVDHLLVAGDLLLASWPGRLAIYDLDDPLSPVPAGAWGAPSFEPAHLAMAGTMAYVADRRSIVSLDLGDPSTPIEGPWSIPFDDPILGLGADAQGVYAVVGDPIFDGLCELVAHDPDGHRLGAAPVWNVDLGATLRCVSGSCYVGTRDGLTLFDTRELLTVPEVGVSGHADHRAIVCRGDLAYTVGDWGLTVFDIGDPRTPTEIHEDRSLRASVLAIHDDYLFVGGDLLRLFSLADPAVPAPVRDYPPMGDAIMDVESRGDDLFVLAFRYGGGHLPWVSSLWHYDIADPLSPERVRTRVLGATRRASLLVDGESVWLAAGNNGSGAGEGLLRYDIADGTLTGGDLSADAFGMVKVGSFLYTAGLNGTAIIDISRPDDPSIAGWISVEGAGAELAGDELYLATRSTGTWLLDVGAPASPRLIGELPVPRTPAAFCLHQGLVIACSGGWGPFAIHIHAAHCDDPSPVSMAHLVATAFTDAVSLAWEAAPGLFVTFMVERRTAGDGFRELATISAGSASSGGPAGAWRHLDGSVTPGVEYGYRIVGRLRDGGTETLGPVLVTAARTVSKLRLLPARPNPTRDSAQLPFSLDRDRPVRLAIYDSAGRHVRTLVDAWLERGSHVELWDGIDERGRRAANGVYFVRLDAGRDTRVNRAVVLR